MDWKARIANYVIGRATEGSTLRGLISALMLAGGYALTDVQLDHLVAAVVAVSAALKVLLPDRVG